MNKGADRLTISFNRDIFYISLLLISALCIGQTANAGSYTKTTHPIVLAHGLEGFDKIPGLEMFYGISRALTRDGAVVYIPNQSSANSSNVRGEQIIEYIENLQAIHGHKKFNLIGHSQGGWDIRYVASVRPDLVASVTTIGSPGTGSGFAEFVVSVAGTSPILSNFIYGGFNLFGSLIEYLSGDNDPQDAISAGHVLSYAGAAEFNEKHPQGVPSTRCANGESVVNGIHYFSFSGIKPFNNIWDPTDYIMSAWSVFDNEPTDGVAGQCATHLGKVVKDNYNWNHLDQINQMYGLRGWGSANPLSVYRAHAQRLKSLGL